MKICISRIDRMGDMFLTLPALKAIKIKNPNIKIYVLASHRNAKVLENLSYINKIIIINTSSKFIAMFKMLLIIRKYNFNFFINLSPTSLSYFFCFFSNARNKATLVFLSRYKKSVYSKLLVRILSKVLCNYVHTINRYEKLKNNEDIHQTKMIFELIKICNIAFDDNTLTEISLTKEKLSLTKYDKSLIILHLTERWINKYYTEENFLELILLLTKNKYRYVLTTDFSTKNKFIKIYDNFNIIDNKNFFLIKKLKDDITILDKLSYKNWLRVIYSSKQIITPECGILHIAGACKVPVTIIYDSDYYPEAMHKEYHPWKSKHVKLVSNDAKLNEKILNNLV